ncbi:MAG: hypothetical protein KC419_11570 [Anaerolineales bacterium]|nr:hypothetical protein [Anaerolineales bacterium]
MGNNSKSTFQIVIYIFAVISMILFVLIGKNKQVIASKNETNSATSDQLDGIANRQLETPLQQALRQAIDRRSKSGLPVPSSTTYQIPEAPTMIQENDTFVMVVSATSTLYFEHPNQAGLDKWPDVVITADLPTSANGYVKQGNYNQEIRSFIEQELPGIWEQHEFGYEPRRYTFRETLRIELPDEAAEKIVSEAVDLIDKRAVEELVFGFTETGPRIEYIVEEEWEECILGACFTIAEVKAGLELDWDIGLRLPFQVDLRTPNSMILDHTYMLDSSITPLDWSAEQYEQAGLEGADGNEFLLRYVVFLGVQAEIVGIEAVDWGIDAEYDGSSSFTTPFGPDASFPLPTIELSPEQTGLQWEVVSSVLAIGIGLRIDTSLSQGEIAAKWQVLPGSDATGNGSVTYVYPQVPVPFGPLTTGDFATDSDQAHIEINDFQYGLDEFLMDLGGYLELELFGYGVEVTDFDIVEIGVDDISDGPWLNIHEGTKDNIETFVDVNENALIFLPLVVK